MAHLHYCLECNTVIGESDEGCEADESHSLEICQSCSQHRAGGLADVEPGAETTPDAV